MHKHWNACSDVIVDKQLLCPLSIFNKMTHVITFLSLAHLTWYTLYNKTKLFPWLKHNVLNTGPYLRTGPRGPGSILKKSRLKYGMQKKKAVHEREI